MCVLFVCFHFRFTVSLNWCQGDGLRCLFRDFWWPLGHILLIVEGLGDRLEILWCFRDSLGPWNWEDSLILGLVPSWWGTVNSYQTPVWQSTGTHRWCMLSIEYAFHASFPNVVPYMAKDICSWFLLGCVCLQDIPYWLSVGSCEMWHWLCMCL